MRPSGWTARRRPVEGWAGGEDVTLGSTLSPVAVFWSSMFSGVTLVPEPAGLG